MIALGLDIGSNASHMYERSIYCPRRRSGYVTGYGLGNAVIGQGRDYPLIRFKGASAREASLIIERPANIKLPLDPQFTP
jgi:hypothetical protein